MLSARCWSAGLVGFDTNEVNLDAYTAEGLPLLQRTILCVL